MVDFFKAFDSIQMEKEEILLAYYLPRETVAAIMMLSKNTKVKFRSPDGDTRFFNIVAWVNLTRLRTSNADWYNERMQLYAKKDNE